MKESSPPKKIHLDCGKYILRNVEVADASDRWGRWLADPEANLMLNVPPVTMTKQEIEDYIGKFDRRTHLLIGIVEKASNKPIGFLRADIDEANSRFLISSFIGEPEYRDKGILQRVTPPLFDYFFETLGMKIMLSTVLSHNRRILHYLRKTGWMLDRIAPGHVKSHRDGTMLDLCYFSHTRDSWRAWKKANLPETAAVSQDDQESKRA